MTQTRRQFAAALIGGFAFSTASFAIAQTSAVTPPETELDAVVLEVFYEDGSDRASREMTLSELMALPVASFETTTVWTEGVQAFEGVWLEDVIAHFGLDQGVLELTALNEYAVTFEVAKIPGSKALVAFRHNGQFMSPRGKGPLWVVYPYDEDTEYQTELTFMESVWQLQTIVALQE